MADEPDNLVLQYLRRIDRKVDEVLEETKLLRAPVGSVESRTVSLHLSDVQQNGEIDRIKHRLDRIERRLELADG